MTTNGSGDGYAALFPSQPYGSATERVALRRWRRWRRPLWVTV